MSELVIRAEWHSAQREANGGYCRYQRRDEEKKERKKKIKRREVKGRRKKINVITRKKMNEMNTRKHEGRKKVERKN